MKTYYVGMDVHQASIVIAVLNGAGRVVMETIVETGADRVRGFIQQLRGKVYVTFEEGTQASWLYEVLRPLVTEVVVCNPRHNKLLAVGNKGDRIDARQLAELLRNGCLRAVYHGENHPSDEGSSSHLFPCIKKGIATGGSGKGYLYSEKEFAPLSKSLDEISDELLNKSANPTVYRRINPNWYLFYDSH